MLSQHRAHFYRRIVAAKLYIDKHYADNIDVGNISSEAGFSRYDFIRQFRRTYGTTPHQYLTKVRLNKAALLLESDEFKVVDVCIMVGFSSPSSFSSLFRRAFGESPRSYQQSRMNRRQELTSKPKSMIPCCFQSLREAAKE